MPSEDVKFFTIPTTGTGTSADGQSIVNLDWGALPAMQEAFRADAVETVALINVASTVDVATRTQ